MNVYLFLNSVGYKPLLNKVKASGGCLRFSKVVFRASSKKSGRKYAKAHLIRRESKKTRNVPFNMADYVFFFFYLSN